MIKGIAFEVTQQFYDALFDLLFTMGVNKALDDADLSGFLEEGQFDLRNHEEIKLQFGEYMSHGDKEVKKRRVDELDIIFKGDYKRNDNDGDINRYGDIWGKLSGNR